MNIKNIKRFLQRKSIKFQGYEVTEGTSKKDTSEIEYLKYILSRKNCQ